jgi:hypothetical protein
MGKSWTPKPWKFLDRPSNYLELWKKSDWKKKSNWKLTIHIFFIVRRLDSYTFRSLFQCFRNRFEKKIEFKRFSWIIKSTNILEICTILDQIESALGTFKFNTEILIWHNKSKFRKCIRDIFWTKNGMNLQNIREKKWSELFWRT